MIRIGITGQSGFIGEHLHNTAALLPKVFELIEFRRSYFYNAVLLDEFVSNCDVIVHLAGVNRHTDADYIYQTNVSLCELLIDSLFRTDSKPHVLFSSSSQEEQNNLYGKSKRSSRELFVEWSRRSGGNFTGLIIPNVFGPFCRPFYNSVVATFCHQITRNEVPTIMVDGRLKLIYVGELVTKILNVITQRIFSPGLVVPHTFETTVSELLATLSEFKESYIIHRMIPDLNSQFRLNLFNTFRCYIDLQSQFPVRFRKNSDDRGSFFEILKVISGGQVSFSTTKEGIVRGNHYHTKKIERFAVIKGEALIQLRRIGTTEVLNFHLSGNEPAFIDMPIWYTHNIKNVGKGELYTIFWVNEFFNPENPDTYFETV